MRRIGLAVVLSLALAPLAAEAQPARVPRLGVLSPFSESFGPSPSFNAFRERLRELGWTEGKNISFEYRWADVKADRLPSLAADLAGVHVDAIFAAYGTPAALAAKNATRTIPIVFANSGDAIGAGLVPSLARPGGNITGTTFLTEETIGKRLELLKEVLPKLARVGVLVNPTTAVSAPVLKSGEAPARAMGIHLQVLEVQAAEDFRDAIEAAGRERAGGLWCSATP